LPVGDVERVFDQIAILEIGNPSPRHRRPPE
jgi:hypothetical protein